MIKLNTCVYCVVTGCILCSPNDSTICDTCDNSKGYYNNNTSQQCSALCGDGMVISSEEECDDGNNDNNDGCSSLCVI